MAGLSAISSLLLVILLGWTLRRTGFLSEALAAGLVRLLYYVGLPALLFRRISSVGPGDITNLNLFLAVHITLFLVPLLAWGLARLFREKRTRLAVSVLLADRSNNVFMGIPVVTAVMGPEGAAGISLYLAEGLVAYYLFSMIWAQIALSGEVSRKSLGVLARSLARNPLILACVLGVAASLLGLGDLPAWLDLFLGNLGSMASGLALLALGASLRIEHPLVSLRSAWRDSLFRLFLHPAVMWAVFRFLPVDPVVERAVILATAMPSAVNNFVLARGMGMDHQYAGEIIAASTVLSVVSVPIWLHMLGLA